MKNTRVRKVLFVIGGILLSLIIILGTMDLLYWIDSDFNPHFREIDSCYDSGGIWDENTKSCLNE
jgi:hypothetical protein